MPDSGSARADINVFNLEKTVLLPPSAQLLSPLPRTEKLSGSGEGSDAIGSRTMTKFIQGSEDSNIWVAYLNICGNANVVGCPADTSVCQSDNGKPPKFISLGTSQSWTMREYYDPLKGAASTPIASGGVAVQISNGDMCGDGTIRSAYMWFKCDPTVTTMPTTLSIAEADPSNPSNPTPCTYYFAPIAFAGFCPNQPAASGSLGAEFAAQTQLFSTLTAATIVTTSPLPLLEAGFVCSRQSFS